MDGLVVNPDALIAGCTPELYATDLVFNQVLEGKNFRDTYKEVGMHLEEVGKLDPVKTLETRKSIGTSGNLGLDEDQLFISLIINGCDEVLDSYAQSYENLCAQNGVQVVLY